MSCSDNMYHKNHFGFAQKCNCQNAYHLNFGNVSLLLSRQQLTDFSTYIMETLVMESTVEDFNARCIYLSTRDYCLMFAMTYNELKSLAEILDHTLLMMEIDDALSVNE